MNGVTVVAVLTRGTHLLAVLTKEAFSAELVTTCPVPAPVTGDAAALCHLTGLLALTVPTPEVGRGKQKNDSRLSCLHEKSFISSKTV